MKRVLLLIGLPVLLAVVWWSGEAGRRNATADVTIDTDKVVEVRGLVISRLATVGATKTAEDTAYTDGGGSDLTFRVPPGRLEEALVELNLVGGVVTRQRVEVDQLNDEVDGIRGSLDGVGGCLDTLEKVSASASNIATCRERLDAANDQLTASPEASRDAVLEVHITRTSTTSVALVVAVILLMIALATMVYLTVRSTRADRVLDITERRPTRSNEDLYHRRN